MNFLQKKVTKKMIMLQKATKKIIILQKSHQENHYLPKKSHTIIIFVVTVITYISITITYITITYITIIIRPGDQKLLLRAADLRSRENL